MFPLHGLWSRRRAGGVLAVAGFAFGAWVMGCSTHDDRIGYVAPPSLESPPLTQQGADAAAETASDAGLCAATECPSPYATCDSSRYRCDKNLDSDNDNCGACGVRCPGSNDTTVESVLHADWRCGSGACQMSCKQGFSDCNGSPGDGCEVNTKCDPNNCGGCGIHCAAGVDCISGHCGCAHGLTQCEPPSCSMYDMFVCKDLSTDDANCGACGNACPPAEDLPPHTLSGCGNGECNRLKCEPGYDDCNGNIQGDGCEVKLADDPNNCGACGFKCGPGQRCSGGQCLCPGGAQLCEFGQGDDAQAFCFYVDVDPNNCGACGRRCPTPPDGATAACRDGRCRIECAPGLADCDDDPRTGCETSTDSDPNNCGGCGIRCDIAAGQPCIRGQCALAPCPDRPVQ